MGRTRHLFALIAFLACGSTAFSQSFFDDVYYNPKKEKTSKSSTTSRSSATAIPDKVYLMPATSSVDDEIYYDADDTFPTYIANMDDMDVDAYNRRGMQYYTSSIDTIGYGVSNEDDFVYTQEIQKYYNPTIVVENADNLGDILASSQGNVDIIINNNGVPVFTPYSSWYYNWYPSSWSFNFGTWGWNFSYYNPWNSWAWGPNWTWGPSWAWGPSWNWGWRPLPPLGPIWRPGHGPGPGPRPHPHPGGMLANYRPHGNSVAAPRPGWSGNTRPNVTPAQRGNVGAHRVVGSKVNTTKDIKPTGAGVVNNNGRWQYNTDVRTHRQPGAGIMSSGNNNGANKGGSVNNRVTGRQPGAGVVGTGVITPSNGQPGNLRPGLTTGNSGSANSSAGNVGRGSGRNTGTSVGPTSGNHRVNNNAGVVNNAGSIQNNGANVGKTTGRSSSSVSQSNGSHVTQNNGSSVNRSTGSSVNRSTGSSVNRSSGSSVSRSSGSSMGRSSGGGASRSSGGGRSGGGGGGRHR